MKRLILLATMMLFLLGFSGVSIADVHIGVNILPPAFTFSAAPELVVIPGTYAYYVPDVNFDLYFYDGFWYRPYGGYWYRSASYGGPWAYIEAAPAVFLSLPPNFRVVTRGYRRIPYAELHSNWRAWHRDRYWEHHQWGRVEPGRMEHQRQHGLAPSYRGQEHGRYQGRSQGVAPQNGERGHGGNAGRVNERHAGNVNGGNAGRIHEGGGPHGGGGGGHQGGAGHAGHEGR